jgi:hypothetical protein
VGTARGLRGGDMGPSGASGASGDLTGGRSPKSTPAGRARATGNALAHHLGELES